MSDRMPNGDRITHELRRKRLTFVQRRKHLDRLEQAVIAGEDEMEFLKRRSRTEFGVLAAALLLVLFGFVIWTTVLDNSDGAEESLDLLSMAEATLTAREMQVVPTETQPPRPTTMPTATLTQSAASGPCSVDLPAVSVPPVVPQGDPAHANWYGSDSSELWVSPGDPGGLLPVSVPEPSSIWFDGGTTYLMWFGASLPIQLTAEQIDGDATIEPVESTNSFNQIQWTNFTFPEPGCWQITGSTSEESMSLTVEVLPREARADYIYLRELYAARPYEEPSACAVTPLTGPEARGNHYVAHYWLEGDGVSADVAGWYVANQEQVMGVYGDDVDEAFSATATKLDGSSGEVIEATTSIWNSDARIARYAFPSPGCWEMQMTTPTTTAAFVVYVYPEECAPAFENDKILVSCKPPQT